MKRESKLLKIHVIKEGDLLIKTTRPRALSKLSNWLEVSKLLQSLCVNKDQIIQKILQNEASLRENGIIRLSLFGSFSRGEQSATSDIDFIWELEKPRTLNSIGKAQQSLNQLFINMKVDTVFESAIHKLIKKKIQEDIIEILK